MQLFYRGATYQVNQPLATIPTETIVKYRGNTYQIKRCAEVKVKPIPQLKYLTYRGTAYMNSVSFCTERQSDNNNPESLKI